MYKVIEAFMDLHDQNYPYGVGDAFPRVGVTVTDKRLKELVAITEGLTVPFIIGGALSGSVAVGLNQVFKQYIEGKDLGMTNGEGEQAEDVETEVVEDESEGKEGEK